MYAFFFTRFFTESDPDVEELVIVFQTIRSKRDHKVKTGMRKCMNRSNRVLAVCHRLEKIFSRIIEQRLCAFSTYPRTHPETTNNELLKWYPP